MEIKLEQLFGLAIRLYALDLFVSMIFEGKFLFDTSVQVYFQTGHFALGIYGLVFIAVMLGLSIFLWKKPLLVAQKLIPASDEKTVKISLTFEELQSLCFTVMGFWIAVNGLLHVFRDVVHVSAMNGVWKTEFDYPRGALGLAQILIGIWAMIGTKGFIKAINKLRG